jgi:hypothetical protein
MTLDAVLDLLADAVFFLYQRAVVNKTVAIGTFTPTQDA